MSRRAADQLLQQGRVSVNGQMAELGHQVTGDDQVSINGKALNAPKTTQTILMNKPVGYVCSRDGQGSQTIYDLLPKELHHLKPVGRLDKDSSGLLLLTNDGDLANQLTHPSFNKTKVYEVKLNQPLSLEAERQLNSGIKLEDGPSQLKLKALGNSRLNWSVQMHEGRNRQVRRSFEAAGYRVTALRRTKLANYSLTKLGNRLYMPTSGPSVLR